MKSIQIYNKYHRKVITILLEQSSSVNHYRLE